MTTHVDNTLLKRMHSDYRAKLAAENAHAETLRARHAEITARLDALEATRGAHLIEARYKLAQVKAARKRKRTPQPLDTLPLFQGVAMPVLTLIIPASVAKSIIRKLSLNTRFLVFDDISLFHESMRLAA